MKVNITDECRNKESLLSRFILNGLTDALMEEVKKDSVKDVGTFCDFKMLINDTEIEFEPFLEYWQSQVSVMIKEKATELMNEKFGDLDDLFYDLRERLEKEIKDRLEDWEK